MSEKRSVATCHHCAEGRPLYLLDADGTKVHISGRIVETIGHAQGDAWWPCPVAPQPGPILSVEQDGRRNEERATCGCMLIGFDGRCALSLPCAVHSGRMILFAMPREEWNAIVSARDVALAAPPAQRGGP